MLKHSMIALGALVLGAALASGAPAYAAKVGVTVGVGAPVVVAPGPVVVDECVAYTKHHTIRYAYCGYPVYSGEPVIIEGVTYSNVHFRTHAGHREFWIKGHWVRHD
jgi:hypothetical protein